MLLDMEYALRTPGHVGLPQASCKFGEGNMCPANWSDVKVEHGSWKNVC